MEKLRKPLLVVLALLCLVGVGTTQKALNQSRETLGLTRVTPLENAPPMLAFTTVALGGFRGLISNALWMRANDLQMDGKFFEMAQLAEWITKLEPHFVQVWLVQAWNMAYNISVKFNDFSDRWRWVQAGIELLRDDGLQYNPNEPLIYRELAWFFQHKMGMNLDDAHLHYKAEWAKEMAGLLGETDRPDLDVLINPKTEEQEGRAALLREKYKMDPEFMKEVDERYGPLDWRLPETHAIYWSAVGLKRAKEHPDRVDQEDLIMLRRAIYQSMQTAFRRGRLVLSPLGEPFQTSPNLDLVPKVSAAYEEQMTEEPAKADHIATAHRNFLKDAAYFLYVYNRVGEAEEWFRYLGQKYPGERLLTGDTNSIPGNISLEEYCFRRVEEDASETDQVRIDAVVEGLITTALISLVMDEEDRAAGLMLLASGVLARYNEETEGSEERLALPSLEEFQRQIVNTMLDPEDGLRPELAAILRTKLGLPPPENPVDDTAPTESPAEGVEPPAGD